MPNRREFLLSSLAIPVLTKLAFPAQSRVNLPGSQGFTVRSQGVATINFDGMIALAMGNPSRVSACILDAHHHTPQMTVYRLKDGARELVAKVEAKQLTGGIFIECDGSTPNALRYHSANGIRGDQYDLDWGINFSELYPQAGQLTIKENLLWGKVHISGGEWYSSRLSDVKWRMVSADAARPAAALNFDRQVGSATCQLNTATNGLMIKGNDIEIRLQADSEVSYEINLENLPPADMANVDHFLNYYSIIEQPLAQYVPMIASKVSFPFPNLCRPVALETNVTVP